MKLENVRFWPGGQVWSKLTFELPGHTSYSDGPLMGHLIMLQQWVLRARSKAHREEIARAIEKLQIILAMQTPTPPRTGRPMNPDTWRLFGLARALADRYCATPYAAARAACGNDKKAIDVVRKLVGRRRSIARLTSFNEAELALARGRLKQLRKRK